LLNLQDTAGVDGLYLRLSAMDVPFSKGRRRNVVLASTVAVASFLAMSAIVSVVVTRMFRRRRQRSMAFMQAASEDGNLVMFRYGGGSFGSVYKGTLPAGAGQVAIAVKKLEGRLCVGEKQFRNEVRTIGVIQHVNLVRLRGFSSRGGDRLLVYDHMPNGSLDRYIYSGDPGAAAALGWETLHEVAAGIARGLEYLHEGCNTRIIHFDIKPQNVLLDADLRPKIADFGMAKLCSPQESILSMADARGTIGFIAPEVFSRGFGVISTKSDVYSYGMLLLEMVAGRSNVKAYAAEKSGGDLFFPLWVYDHLLQDGGVLQVRGEEVARKMALIGLWCIQTVPASRPSMSRVLEMLERSIHELAMPPRPYHVSPSNSPSPSHPSSYPSSTSDFTLRCVCLPQTLL